MASVRLNDVSKAFVKGQWAVRELTLHIADGELMVIVGPSGCGKTTTLRMIAGLETPTQGQIFLDEREVTHLSPQKRDLAMVFQSHALYPHKTVRANLAFGLKMRGESKAVIADRVQHAARILGLSDLLERKPSQLSGGQRQRVALGRAIVREPRAFLLDEPLSNLDVQLRVHMRAELGRLHRQLGATLLYVTHDQEEAMTLGNRVAVLHNGELQQVAPPMELYHRPANTMVGGFIGSPAMNFFRARCTAHDGELHLEGEQWKLRVDALSMETQQDVIVGIRPQDIHIGDVAGSAARGIVDVVQPLGPTQLLHLRVGKPEDDLVTVMDANATQVRVGDEVGLWIERERVHVFEGDSGKRLSTSEGNASFWRAGSISDPRTEDSSH